MCSVKKGRADYVLNTVYLLFSVPTFLGCIRVVFGNSYLPVVLELLLPP